MRGIRGEMGLGEGYEILNYFFISYLFIKLSTILIINGDKN